MFNQMIRVWISIPFIMFFLVVTGTFADFMWRLTSEHYYTVATVVLILSLSGLVVALYKVIKNDTNRT